MSTRRRDLMNAIYEQVCDPSVERSGSWPGWIGHLTDALLEAGYSNTPSADLKTARAEVARLQAKLDGENKGTSA